MFILALPLLLMIAVNSGLLNEIKTDWITIPLIPEYQGSDLSLSHFAVSIPQMGKIFTTDGEPQTAMADFGTIFYMSIPLFVAGVFALVRDTVRMFVKKLFCPQSVVLCALVACFFGVGLKNAVYIHIAIGVYSCVLFAVAMGLREVYRAFAPGMYVLLTMMSVMLVLFCGEYFNHLNIPGKSLPYTQNNAIEALKYARELKPDAFVYFTSMWSDYGARVSYIYPLLSDLEDPYVFNQTKSIQNGAVCYGRYSCYLPAILKEDGSIIWEIYPDSVYVLCTDYATETTYAVFDKLEEEGFTLYDGLPPYRIYYYED